MHLICLHNVMPGPMDAFDKKCSRISTDEFAQFLDEVAARFELISYSAYERLLRAGQGRDDAVALSFDDGFWGVIAHAKPILDARGLDAIAFINPPYLGNPPGEIFHFLELEIAFRLTEAPALSLSFVPEVIDLEPLSARVKTLKTAKKLLKTRPEPERVAGHREVLAALQVPHEAILGYAQAHEKFRIMTADELRELRAGGWAIGAHTMSHRTLSMLPPEEQSDEIVGGMRYFSSHFGWQMTVLAYPYGDVVHVGDEVPKVSARAGFEMAYTTVPGPSDFAQAPHRLPRIDYKRFLREQALLGAA